MRNKTVTLITDTNRKWVILAALTLLVVLVNIDYTAVNLALVAISYDVAADLNTLQWLLSAYVLAWSASNIPAGKLADIYGKRRMLCWGISIFMFGSLLCYLVNGVEMLIIARILQGIGGALFCPPVYSLTFASFTKDKQGLAIGILGTGAGLGLAIGPSFAGIIINLAGWRWIFLVNVPLCLITIWIVLFSVAKEPRRVSADKLDILGALIFAISLVLFTFALNQTEVWGTSDQRLWEIFIVSALFFWYFIMHSRKQEHPLIPRSLFRNKAFLACTFGLAIYEFAFSAVLVLLGLYFQNVLGFTTYKSGIVFLSMTLAMGALSPFGGRLVDKVDPRISICGGMAFMLPAMLYAATFKVNSSVMEIGITLLLLGIGFGLGFPAYNAAMMKSVNESMLNTASGFLVMLCTLACTLGVVISTSLLVGLGWPILTANLLEKGIALNANQQQALLDILAAAHRDPAIFLNFDSTIATDILSALNLATMEANSIILLIISACTVLAIFVAFKWIRLKTRDY